MIIGNLLCDKNLMSLYVLGPMSKHIHTRACVCVYMYHMHMYIRLGVKIQVMQISDHLRLAKQQYRAMCAHLKLSISNLTISPLPLSCAAFSLWYNKVKYDCMSTNISHYLSTSFILTHHYNFSGLKAHLE